MATIVKRSRDYGRLFTLATSSLLAAGPAYAGMPMLVLTDLATLRLRALSFFIALLLVTTLGVRWAWNQLRGDFPVLPLLDFKHAFALVVIWGLAFNLVLTMISGARELMTPGAWAKDGATYRLADRGSEDGRRQQLEQLRVHLWRYAQAHDGRLPPDDEVAEIPAEAWSVFNQPNFRYVYFGGLRVDEGSQPVAYEPGLFAGPRLVLKTDGEIERLDLTEIHALRADDER